MNRLLQGFVILCLGFGLRATAASPFAREIAAFEARAKTNPPPQEAILFLGSSSIRKWNTLVRDFPGHTVINRGFGGSQISDSIYYFDRIVLPLHPKIIVFYAGSNDIAVGKKPETVVNDFETLARKMESELPGTKLAFISIATSPSRWTQVEKVKEANRDIADFIRHDQKLAFINIFDVMLDSDGKPQPDLYVADRLHMTAKGYAIWTSIIAPYLDKADPAAPPSPTP